MLNIRVTLSKDQVRECMMALYKAGNPLGDEFRHLLDRIEQKEAERLESEKAETPRREAAQRLSEREKSETEKILERARKHTPTDDEVADLFRCLFR